MMQVLWEGYAAAMQEAGFNDQTPLFAASGLLTYGATQGTLPVAVHTAAHDMQVASCHDFEDGTKTTSKLDHWCLQI